MRKILLLILGFSSMFLQAQKPETQKISTHNGITINTDVSTGSKSFNVWGVFPKENVPVRKITLFLTLAHPDTMPIAHWDYLDFINIRRKGGVNGPDRNIEIARMITPYGSSFTKDWSFTWDVDVTDFSLLLRDSVEIEYIHTGYEPSFLGWTLSLDFEFLIAPPAAQVLSIQELYRGQFPYGNAADPIENYLKPVDVSFHPEAGFGRIRIQHTGHGYDNPKGCSEFCSRWREVKHNGIIIDHRDMWKKCGSNPLYPQGGTWLFDRAYWCPGDLQAPDQFDIRASEGKHQILFAMEPYEASERIEAKEVIGAYFIQYKAPVNKNDVALERIEVPSNNPLYSRFNPAVFNPVVVIRNLGSETLKSATIVYGTKGFKSKRFEWKGQLAFNQTATIVLPGEIDYQEGKNMFEARIEKPNGKKDAWVFDNSLSSEFNAPKKLPLEFVIQYKTNLKPEDNHLFIVNLAGDTLYQRKPAQCEPNTLYQDTIRLAAGNYTFEMTDSAGDGLEFWAIPQNGYGFIRILDMEKNILHHFVSDCGNGQFLAFNAHSSARLDANVSQNAFFLYPRRTKKNLELDAFLATPGKLRVQFMADGKAVETHEYTGFKEGTLNYNLAYLPAGRYIVEIFVDDILVHKNRINRD